MLIVTSLVLSLLVEIMIVCLGRSILYFRCLGRKEEKESVDFRDHLDRAGRGPYTSQESLSGVGTQLSGGTTV